MLHLQCEIFSVILYTVLSVTWSLRGFHADPTYLNSLKRRVELGDDCFCAENCASTGLSSDIPEADAKKIAEMARRTFDKYVWLLLFRVFVIESRNVNFFVKFY